MRKHIYNFNWLFLEKTIKIVGNLLITVWVSRYLGTNDFGVISYSLAFIAFFSWASHLGLDQIVVRELIRGPNKADQILGSALFMKFFGAIISIILISIVIAFIMPGDVLVRSTVGLASLIYIFRAFDVVDIYYQAKVLSKYTTIARNVAFILSIGLQVYFIIGQYPVIYFVAVFVIESCLAALFMLYLFSVTENSLKRWKFDRFVAIDLFQNSWPLMISVFLISVHMKIDQIMIGSMLDLEDVGIYAIAVKVSESWYFIPAIIVSTVMPYFIALKGKDETLYKERLMILLSCMFWLGASVGIVTYFIGKEAIVILFGNEYKSAYYALLYNIWGGIFIAQGLAASILVIAENLQSYRLYIQILAVCTNVGLNVILIPELGITGAAVSTLLTYFLATWVYGLLFKDIRPVTLMMIRASLPHRMIFLKRNENG